MTFTHQKVEGQNAPKREKMELTAAMAQAPNTRQLSSEAGGHTMLYVRSQFETPTWAGEAI